MVMRLLAIMLLLMGTSCTKLDRLINGEDRVTVEYPGFNETIGEDK